MLSSYSWLKRKHLIDELLKLLVGEGVAEFTERIGKSPIVPLVVFGILGVEEVPEGIALLGIVAGSCISLI
jgi:hypothetical protein